MSWVGRDGTHGLLPEIVVESIDPLMAMWLVMTFVGEALQEATSGDSAYEAIHRVLRNLQQPGAAGQVPSKTGKERWSWFNLVERMPPAGLSV